VCCALQGVVFSTNRRCVRRRTASSVRISLISAAVCCALFSAYGASAAPLTVEQRLALLFFQRYEGCAAPYRAWFSPPTDDAFDGARRPASRSKIRIDMRISLISAAVCCALFSAYGASAAPLTVEQPKKGRSKPLRLSKRYAYQSLFFQRYEGCAAPYRLALLEARLNHAEQEAGEAKRRAQQAELRTSAAEQCAAPPAAPGV
jgi:hypothetical protein